MKNFIDVRRITKQYETAKALNNVSLTIPEGSLTAIVGKSGCGKTTILNMIGGLDTPSCGEVYVTGKCITAMKERELSRFRADSIGFVFQFFDLVPEFTAAENILLPQVLSRKPVDREHYSRLISVLGIGDFENRLPSELSGGEQQRVAIARALVNNPRLIIADEPTGNLDPARSLELMTLFEKINELGTTVLIVTHEKGLVDEFEKRVVMIDHGSVVSDQTGGYYQA